MAGESRGTLGARSISSVDAGCSDVEATGQALQLLRGGFFDGRP